MIGSLTGTVLNIHDNKIILQLADIGLELFCPTAKTFSIQQKIHLITYLHWSAENGPTLFGFVDQLQKDLFMLMIDCHGIGPKLALSILEQVDAQTIIQAVAQENMTYLNNIKGLGSKKIEQLFLHLKNKATKLLIAHPQLAQKTTLSLWKDLQDTLLSLNYSTQEIKLTINALKNNNEEKSPTFDMLLRKALSLLVKK